MISKLTIQNLILIEKAEITFGPGLNILTGETGSGKSAVLTAIRLLTGERADIQWIRKGAELAIVEAMIGPHIVRRELHRSGRSRSFIDDELVTLQELKALPIELVDQNSSMRPLEFLDLFGDVPSCKAEYHAWRDSLARLAEGEKKQIAEDVAFLQEINYKTGEEEALSQEHHLLVHGAELIEKVGHITQLLGECIPSLKRAGLDSLLKIEPKLQEVSDWFKTGILNLEEVLSYLNSYASRLETDPKRLMAVEERISELESVKRRFGSFEQAQRFLETAAEFDLDALKQECVLAESTLQKKIARITELRQKAATTFEKAILKELINLPDARLSIELTPKEISETGAESIQILFSANPGHPLLPLDRCASGGELSRLLFAVKVALGHKEQTSCLIFDEIDSNVGGKTAAILGAKLQELAQNRQLICITHFVQVAKCATDHFLVSKKGATTYVEKLLDRTTEYDRMMGSSE